MSLIIDDETAEENHKFDNHKFSIPVISYVTGSLGITI